ncbi:uncharacterized protein isoform X2 [Choristoneura fumiferana]|uniref:uncharacterized protein isoform X2 n=1 Tax=Choristoneura fumiferana TaxID=7141 RepID=UPI003D15EA8C
MLEKCCFSVELRIGCIIIAVFGILSTGYALLVPAIQSSAQLAPWLHGLYSFWNIGRILLGVLGLLVIIASFMVIVGIRSEMSWMVLPWFGAIALYLIFIFAVGIYTVIKTEQYHQILGPIFQRPTR